MKIDSDTAQSSELATLMERFIGQDGTYVTAIPALHLSRASAPQAPMHGVCEPSLCIIAQGRKQVMLAGNVYTYSPVCYLLVAVDLPVVGHVVEASPEAPYLGLRLDIDPQQIGALLTEADTSVASSGPSGSRGLCVGFLDATLLDAVTRLLRLLDTPQHIVLAPLIYREILYLLLVGEHRQRLCQIALSSSEQHSVVKALQWIKCNFMEPMRIETLALESNMSPSVFHHHFKALTAMTPLQYQKRLRLQEARRLMLGEAVDAGMAGYRVGYESASQFSREYRRLFGDSPRRDMVRLRDASQNGNSSRAVRDMSSSTKDAAGLRPSSTAAMASKTGVVTP
jgi:AraC-like DNA-binding protein